LKASIDRVNEVPPLEKTNLQCKGVHPLKTSIDSVKEGSSTPGNHQYIVQKGVHPLKASVDRVKEASPLENIILQCKRGATP
jgi:hypothetical protein